MNRQVVVFTAIILCILPVTSCKKKNHNTEISVFYPPELVCAAQNNAKKYDWAAQARNQIVEQANRWMELSNDQLWALMFSPTLERSWMVWSNGHCPVCKKDVGMYNWIIEAWKQPWKVQCPHCQEYFPKNDFEKFYVSGLDGCGIFRYEKADKDLLYNVNHPDANDPLRKFGVDDGRGYTDGENTWRFIGTYLVYGQWKQKVMAGITQLADAYTVTGDPNYARKAGILLDRVADLYPDFDFRSQGWMYEKINNSQGYVTYWQKSGLDGSSMALAFDQIRRALAKDSELVEFLSKKAKTCKLENPKNGYNDIKRNIFERIFQESIDHPEKIYNNFPLREQTIAYMNTVMYWPQKRAEIMRQIKAWMAKAVCVNGLTGEKGIYSGLAPTYLVNFMGKYNRIDPTFIKDMMELLPGLQETFRFHIDTRALEQYNILPGDNGLFAHREEYPIVFSKNINLEPSIFSFFGSLYDMTKDPIYVQLLYQQNNCRTKGLPYDLFCENPEDFETKVSNVISKFSSRIEQVSVDKQQWHLAILRSGEPGRDRLFWLDYDNMGGHRHCDAMTLGLYAKGLDLMCDFGYPPVQFGGWEGSRRQWYSKTVSHNTVVVDGKDVGVGSGRTTLWADGKQFRAVRVSGPQFINGKQYERTVAMIDISGSDSYLVDIFRVVGGKDHAKFMSSTFGAITTQGLSLEPAQEYGHGALMRNFQCDKSPEPVWSVDWKIKDYYNYLPDDADIHLRYTDLSQDVQAFTAEAWIAPGGFASNDEQWIPRIMIRRTSQSQQLASTFVGVIEPYEKTSNIAAVRRLNLANSLGQLFKSANAALEVQLADGRKDLIIAMDTENPLRLEPLIEPQQCIEQKDWGLRFIGELAFVRIDEKGKPQHIAICKGSMLEVGTLTVKLKENTAYKEIDLAD